MSDEVVWRFYRRYKLSGLDKVLAYLPRVGKAPYKAAITKTTDYALYELWLSVQVLKREFVRIFTHK